MVEEMRIGHILTIARGRALLKKRRAMRDDKLISNCKIYILIGENFLIDISGNKNRNWGNKSFI